MRLKRSKICLASHDQIALQPASQIWRTLPNMWCVSDGLVEPFSKDRNPILPSLSLTTSSNTLFGRETSLTVRPSNLGRRPWPRHQLSLDSRQRRYLYEFRRQRIERRLPELSQRSLGLLMVRTVVSVLISGLKVRDCDTISAIATVLCNFFHESI